MVELSEDLPTVDERAPFKWLPADTAWAERRDLDRRGTARQREGLRRCGRWVDRMCHVTQVAGSNRSISRKSQVAEKE